MAANSRLRRRSLLLVGLLSSSSVALWLGSVANAQNAPVDVVVVDVEHAVTTKANNAVDVRDSSTYRIAADGVYRVDTVTKTTRTAEIVDTRRDRRVSLNLDTREARVGRASIPGQLPPSSGRQPVPGGAPSAWTREGSDSVDLGTITLGGLSLRGTRQTHRFGRGGLEMAHVVEIWVYHPPDRRNVPIPLQIRFDMPDQVDERRITDVRLEQASPDTFEVPAGFRIVQQ